MDKLPLGMHGNENKDRIVATIYCVIFNTAAADVKARPHAIN